MVLWIGLVVGSRARAFPRGHREQQQPTATANLMVPHRLPCPRPGAAEAGTWLPRQERRRGGLRIATVSMSGWENPVGGTITPVPSMPHRLGPNCAGPCRLLIAGPYVPEWAGPASTLGTHSESCTHRVSSP